MKLLRRIFIGLGAAGFVLAALTVLLFNRSAFGWQALSVPTGSMRPTFAPGALVLTHRVATQNLKVGDIITYTNPLTMHSTLTHRITKVYKLDGKIPAFITQGDANPSPDPPVVAGLVQGRMVGHVPFVGEIFMWAKTWAGIAALIYLPALIIMFEETRRLAKYLRKMKLYRLDGWRPRRVERKLRPVPAMAGSVAVAIALSSVGWQTAGAITGQNLSNTVALSPNVLTASIPKPPTTNTPSCNNNVNVNNSSNRTTKSGSVSATGGGSATSGSVSNSNSTNINVNVNC